MTEILEHLKIGPKDGITYPITVQYCGNCTMPIEVSDFFLLLPHKSWHSICIVRFATSFLQYCEYYPDYEKCKAWLEKNLPDEFSKVKLDGDATTAASATGDDAGGEDKKKSQRRGGKGILKAKKVKADGPRKICVSRAPRGKKKSVTVVTGLSTFGSYLT